MLINITGSSEMTIHDVHEASCLVQEESHEDANIIFGAVIDETMGEEVRVTVIATGFGKMNEARAGDEASVIADAEVIENLELPAFVRKDDTKTEELRNSEIRRYSQMGGLNLDDEDIYDTPTFLRKQAD